MNMRCALLHLLLAFQVYGIGAADVDYFQEDVEDGLVDDFEAAFVHGKEPFPSDDMEVVEPVQQHAETSNHVRRRDLHPYHPGDHLLTLRERPQGIANGPGPYIFISQILSGQVLAFNTHSGHFWKVLNRTDLALNKRQAWGIWYHRGYLIVAGGGSSFGDGKSEVYVYHVHSGKLRATCAPPPQIGNGTDSFLYDVTVRGSYAYITDSYSRFVMTLNVRDAALHGNCSVGYRELDPVFDGDSWTNGIVPFAYGLLVAQEAWSTAEEEWTPDLGSVWYLNLRDNTTTEIIADKVPGADGLTVRGNILYVTQKLPHYQGISVYALQGGYYSYYNNTYLPLEAHYLGFLSSKLYNTPSLSVIYGDSIFSTNTWFYDANFTFPEDDLDPAIHVPSQVVVRKLWPLDTPKDTTP